MNRRRAARHRKCPRDSPEQHEAGCIDEQAELHASGGREEPADERPDGEPERTRRLDG
jgi:hypothetical protein